MTKQNRKKSDFTEPTKDIYLVGLDKNVRYFTQRSIDEKVKEYKRNIKNNLNSLYDMYNNFIEKQPNMDFDKLTKSQFQQLLGYKHTNRTTYQSNAKSGNLPMDAILRASIVFGVNPIFLLFGEKVFLSHYSAVMEDYKYGIDLDSYRMIVGSSTKDSQTSLPRPYKPKTNCKPSKLEKSAKKSVQKVMKNKNITLENDNIYEEYYYDEANNEMIPVKEFENFDNK